MRKVANQTVGEREKQVSNTTDQIIKTDCDVS
jgi:hypothetical protein